MALGGHGPDRRVVALALLPIQAIADLGWLAIIVSISFIPIAIGIAILRYRLYEFDRIISRTLGYAAVTITLAIVFVGVVLGLTAVLEPVTSGNTVAVAASTLLVAALFQPLRRRIQQVVDRRFNRARYDAQRMAEAFARQLAGRGRPGRGQGRTAPRDRGRPPTDRHRDMDARPIGRPVVSATGRRSRWLAISVVAVSVGLTIAATVYSSARRTTALRWLQRDPHHRRDGLRRDRRAHRRPPARQPVRLGARVVNAFGDRLLR